jgi:hypothetical protein
MQRRLAWSADTERRYTEKGVGEAVEKVISDMLERGEIVRPGDAVPQTSSNPADDLVAQVEQRFPNWKSYRDLLDCIDCTLHQLRAEVRS